MIIKPRVYATVPNLRHSGLSGILFQRPFDYYKEKLRIILTFLSKKSEEFIC